MLEITFWVVIAFIILVVYGIWSGNRMQKEYEREKTVQSLLEHQLRLNEMLGRVGNLTDKDKELLDKGWTPES
jgi:uncharacterized protein YoxC